MSRVPRAAALGPSAFLAAMLVLGAGLPVAAEEIPTTVTRVTINRVAHISGKFAPSIQVTGTLACDAAGPAEPTEQSATQHGVQGQANLDLLDFPCTTEPRPFRVVIETFGCDESSGAGCFRRGKALVRFSATDISVERRVTVRQDWRG